MSHPLALTTPPTLSAFESLAVSTAITHLEDASTAILSALSNLSMDDDDERKTYDPVTPMAAVLRSIGVAMGLLDSVLMSGREDSDRDPSG